MTPRRSLRSQLIIGAVLWTAGTVVVITYLIPVLTRHFPHMQNVVHWTLMSVTAAIFILAGLSQVRSGLSPIRRLQDTHAAIRGGGSTRVDGAYPSEVQPLVNDLNALLENQERQVARAQAAAGDLAHGLKTPLALLGQEADRARAAGQIELAGAITQQVDRMRRQIDYHLAHARAAASGATLGARCPVKDTADGLARTLLRLHADRGLTIDVTVPADHVIRGQREDLEEMLGNLLDNACKWAKTRVTIGSVLEAEHVVILVDDDGPGLAASMRQAVLQRGVRADEAAPGSGFGLAIVRDLAELYDGSITLDGSPLGGLRARLRLPAG
jgi:signal transduction histidine kinase